MPILTNFLKLLKPEKNDYVDVEKHISENYDKIDNKMEELSSSNDEKLNKGNVSSEYDTAKKIEDKIKTAQGTADNKLNKGNLPTTITDAKEIYDLLENNSGLNFDKNLLFLNDKGVKTQGKIYFDRNKVGMFECIKTTPEDYVANSTTYFVDISNKSSSDRLSNLNKVFYGKHTLDKPISLDFKTYKCFYLRLIFDKENVRYGSEAEIFQDTKEISSIGISSVSGIIAANFSIANNTLFLTKGKVYYENRYQDYSAISPNQYFFTVELYALKNN